MPKLVLVSNKVGGRSIRSLAETLSKKLGFKVFRVRPGRERTRLPVIVGKGVDKLTQLKCFKQAGVECPEFTSSIDEARKWFEAKNTVVVCRKLTRASEGRGIVIAEEVDHLVPAPLYTKYVPKKEEYRVHVFDGAVIDIQHKRKKKGFEDERNTRVRNIANGYVFCREGLTEPAGIRELAIKAVDCLGLRFGGVDIAYNVKNSRLVVLEVNSNPGMQGTTLEKYSEAIKQDFNLYNEFYNSWRKYAL